LAGIDFGVHTLTLYSNVAGFSSSDSIPLPMRDVWVGVSVSPPEFNNKLDSIQFFTIDLELRNYTSSASYTVISTIPSQNGTNPRAIVQSGTEQGPLQFEGFISNNTSQGRYSLNYSLPVSLAQSFEDGDHELLISVTTVEKTMGNTTTQFSAKGTIYRVDLEEIQVESYSTLDYDQLVSSSQDDVKLRLNVNDSVTITFRIFDMDQGTNSTRVHSVGFQDPKKPEDPAALLHKDTDTAGVGSITLFANETTPQNGYTLLFFVRGHRTFQESEAPSNITIFWDLLIFEYIYSDSFDEGSNLIPNQKALGLDVNSSWQFELRLKYASDGTSAIGGNISYRFGGGTWTNLTDGLYGDLEDGVFIIQYTHTSPNELLFECRIISGSKIDPQGSLFVTNTEASPIIDLSVTWTYLIVDIGSGDPDARLSTLSTTYIELTVVWAHNFSFFALPDELFLLVYDHFWKNSRPIQIVSGIGSYTGVVNIYDGKYRFSVIGVVDNIFGVSRFTNSTIIDIQDPQVQIDIIWESVLFSYSNAYNSSRAPENQSWGVDSFFANYGDNATLYIYGRHSYDDTPFNGTATLWAFELAESYIVNFVNGIAIWTGNLTKEGFEISFSVMEISIDLDFGIESVGTYDNVIISWDKIVVTLEANRIASHGTWIEVNVTYSYLIQGDVDVDPNNVSYTLHLSNGTIREQISWISFLDFSLYPTAHRYNITDVYDSKTGLNQEVVQFKWLDIDMDPEPGDLVVYWIDDQDPIIVELQSYDLGNGTIIIVVDVSDKSEQWIGSGIASVYLNYQKDNWVRFPGISTNFSLGQGVYRFYFRFSNNQLFNDTDFSDDYFQFDFNDPLTFTLEITDTGSNQFPEILGDRRDANTFTTAPFTITTNYDPFNPTFISTNGEDITYIFPELADVLLDKPSITDGDIIISVEIQDNVWSGIDRENIRLSLTNLDSNETLGYSMIDNSPSLSKREVLRFSWSGPLDVGNIYRITVIIQDNAGNTNFRTIEVHIEDHVAPRIELIEIVSNDDREFKISIYLNETGFGVDLVQVAIMDGNKTIKWVNLTKQSGAEITDLDMYYGEVTIPFDILDFLLSNSYSIEVNVTDRANNHKRYRNNELKDLQLDFNENLNPVVLHPYVLFTGLILLISAILVGIRVTSRTEGYDMSKIFSEGEKIPREVILTQMDEYALGVTINFFDQVQGPVPVIWEPALLEDQQQVMLDLSDKSFSTLEFIGLDETERSGTFDFSTGSYECTALGYSFAVDNPQARGGKENLTVVLLLRKEWGDNLLVFQDELTEKLREIREMIETQKEPTLIEKKARELREYVSRIMLSFNKIYAGLDYELAQQEE
ncbi:MAG: hypothetical protein ACW96X_04520, partial [Promethearchaeota archaeon]